MSGNILITKMLKLCVFLYILKRSKIMVSARKKHRIKKVYSTQKVYTFLGFPKSRVGNDAEHICDLDHPNCFSSCFEPVSTQSSPRLTISRTVDQLPVLVPSGSPIALCDQRPRYGLRGK